MTTNEPGSFLDKMRALKRAEVAAIDPERLARARALPPRDSAAGQGLRERLSAISSRGQMAVIAEIKRASPSVGMIHPDLDAPAQARLYASGGAAAISVLTEPAWFKGSLEDLATVSAAVDVPTLRKDFILDRDQIDMARASGAAAVLLIVAFLDPEQLGELLDYARQRGLDALVEAHDLREAEIAVEVGADIVGVNARNLKTLAVDREMTLRVAPALAALCGDAVIRVAESGIKTPDHARDAWRAGYRAALVGEALVRDDDPAEAVSLLLHAPDGAR